MAADGGYASRITHTFYAFARPRCRRGPTHHVLRTRIPDSSEKWWLTGVTPHVLRMVLVQEAHPAKGGTLEELRAECPEDLQAAIFERTWRLAVWHRIESFQLVSLKIIAEASRSMIERPCCSDSRWLALQ